MNSAQALVNDLASHGVCSQAMFGAIWLHMNSKEDLQVSAWFATWSSKAVTWQNFLSSTRHLRGEVVHTIRNCVEPYLKPAAVLN